jgi:hypothetical protein
MNSSDAPKYVTNMPYVFILDIDGTMIGDIGPQVMMYDIISELRRGKEKIFFDTNDLIEKLKSGVVRPHLAHFISSMKRHYGAVEFFVYTASHNKWANFLIKQLEKSLGIRFNRPIFTRKDCQFINKEYKKSIKHIKGRIFNVLKKKYDYPFHLEDMADKIMMIDNNNIFPQSEQGNLIVCPTYSFKYPENIPIKITKKIYEANERSLSPIMNRYLNIPIGSSYLKFQRAFYRYYINEISSMSSSHDSFWLHLTDVLIKKDIKVFNIGSLKYVSSKLRSDV